MPAPPPAPPPGPAGLPHHLLRPAELPHNRTHAFDIAPTAAQCAAVADTLGIVAVRKLRLTGRLTPEGRTDWRLTARLGATVVQDCVVTLDPVTSRIDEDLARLYRADIDPPRPGEFEMPEDDAEESLPAELNLGSVMIEALALALPLYPRKDGAAPLDIVVTEPGKVPMTREEMKPFSGLAGLRARLTDAGDGDGDGDDDLGGNNGGDDGGDDGGHGPQ